MKRARIICFCGIILGALFLPFWFFIVLAIFYALVFSPYELLPLAVLIDAGFGSFERGVWYAYTISVSFMVIITHVIRPYLRFYQ